MITYDYYRIFYYVAQYKSFTRAAEALHNNQCSRSKFLSYFLIFFVKNFHITLFHFTEKRSYFFVVKQRFKEILYTDRG